MGHAIHAFLSTSARPDSQSSCYKTPSPARRYIQKPVRQTHPHDRRVITNSLLPSMACINSTFQSCSIARGAKISTRGARGSSGGKGSPTFQCRASTFVDAASLRLELDENPEAIISRVWPENASFLSYDDLRAYLESQETAQVDDQVLLDLSFFLHHCYMLLPFWLSFISFHLSSTPSALAEICTFFCV